MTVVVIEEEPFVITKRSVNFEENLITGYEMILKRKKNLEMLKGLLLLYKRMQQQMDA